MRHNLNQLHAELAAAGIAVPALGSTGGDLHTYSPEGRPLPLPKEALKVVKAHKPAPDARAAALETLRASKNPDIRALLVVLGLA